MDCMDALIARAEALLCWMDRTEAAAQLMETGVSAEDAFLAVMAASVVVA